MIKIKNRTTVGKIKTMAKKQGIPVDELIEALLTNYEITHKPKQAKQTTAIK